LLARSLIALRRRLGWVLSTALVVVALTVVTMQRVPLEYRATATLSIEEPITSADTSAAALSRYAQERVAARHAEISQRVDYERILAEGVSSVEARRTVTPAMRVATLRERMTARVLDVSLIGSMEGNPDLVSVIFSVSVEDQDRRVVAETLNAVLALYAQIDSDGVTSEMAREIDALDVVIEQSSLTIKRLESSLAEFMRENPGVSDETDADNSALDLARSELSQLDLQSQRYTERSLTIASALREVDPRGTLSREVSGPGEATPERLAALQTMLALLKGRHGIDHPDVETLSMEVMSVNAELELDLDQRIQELRTAQAEYDRLKQLHALDYPDVVRLANTVSHLEGVIADEKAIGLPDEELRRIELLAREEGELRAAIDELQLTRAALRQRVADLESSAARAPFLYQQQNELRENLSSAEENLVAALDDRQALEYEYDLLVQLNSPPELLSAPTSVPESMLQTRPTTIVAAGMLFGVLCIGAIVAAVERVDRRVLGAKSIVAIYGTLPLAEIPIIPEPSIAPGQMS
jgi:uncharacterized protein involved in exopolysaccharide biosynthesis